MRSFWTSIEFVAKSNYDGCPPGQFRADAYTTRSNLPLFRDILQRSASLPLTISLHVHFGAEGVIPALVTALEPHAERLVALHYRGRAHHISALLDKLPGLAKLRSITTEGGMQYYDFYPFTQDASRLPSLERLVLAEKLLLPSPSAIFRALRSLSMTIPRLTYIHDIVSACPNLQQLRLNLGYAGENECRAVPGSLVDVLRPIPNIRFSGLSRGRLRNVLDGISVAGLSDVLQATLCNATLTISAHGSANRSRLVTLTSLGGSWSVTLSR